MTTPQTTKTKAFWYAIGSAVTGYLAYFIALPPSLQTGILGDIINLLPADAQPAAGTVTKTISTFLGFYATFKAAQSGPSTPPKNNVTE